MIERALRQLQEGLYSEAKHPRGRGGRWMEKLRQPRDEFSKFPYHENPTADDWATHNKLKDEWDAAATRAVALGHASQEDLKAKGWNPGTEWKPLPPVLYHATIAASAVREAGGLKPRSEVADHGLGGGPDDVVSFTADPAIAHGIRDSVLELHGMLTNPEAAVQDMAKQAREGTGTTRPYFVDLLRFHGGRGKDESAVNNASWRDLMALRHRESRMFTLKKPPTAEEWRKEGFEPAPEGLLDWGGEERYNQATRPMTESEKRQAVGEMYQNWAAYREHYGGPLYPLFWGLDADKMAALDPQEAQVVTADAVPGALGTQQGSLGEWRTIGDAVTIRAIGDEPLLPSSGLPAQPRPEIPTWQVAERRRIQKKYETDAWMEEGTYEERLHPRGRGGRWVNILGKMTEAKPLDPHEPTWKWSDAQTASRYGFVARTFGDAVPSGYNGSMVAYEPATGKKMGHLDYQTASHDPLATIAMIEVEPEYRRQGVATRLLDYVRHADPERGYSWGMTTPEGEALTPVDARGVAWRHPTARGTRHPGGPGSARAWHRGLADPAEDREGDEDRGAGHPDHRRAARPPSLGSAHPD